MRISLLASASLIWPPIALSTASDLDSRAFSDFLVLVERGDGLLVGLLLRVQPRETGIDLRDQRLGFGLEVVGPEALEFELELQLCGLFLERRLGVLDALLDRLDGLVLVGEVLSSFLAEAPVVPFRSSMSALRAFLMTAAVTFSSSSGS